MLIAHDQKFGKLRIKEPQELARHSHLKVEWVCDCGNHIFSSTVLSGKTRSCGRCNLILADQIAKMKFGKLRIRDPQDIMPGSGKKLVWMCDCGNEADICVGSVVKGITRSCGRCNLILADQIAKMKFGKLRIRDPQDVMPRSDKELVWMCDCGREFVSAIKYILSGRITSCGKCNLISGDRLERMKFGKLRVKPPVTEAYLGSPVKLTWICDCGREVKRSVRSVSSRHNSSCGKCNLIPAVQIAEMKFGKLRIRWPRDVLPGSKARVEWLCDCGGLVLASVKQILARKRGSSCGKCNKVSARRFGRLTAKHPIEVSPSSKRKMTWICDCGQEVDLPVAYVIMNGRKSCGKCATKVRDWYRDNENIIRSVRCPVEPDEFIPGGVVPLAQIAKTGDPFPAVCAACGELYHPCLDNIKQGLSLTCGCVSNRTSKPVEDIRALIQDLGVSAHAEHGIDGFKYDLFIQAKNLLIEYNGLKWHSMPESKRRDQVKYKHATDNGFSFFCVFEDEWKWRRSVIESVIRNKLGVHKVSIRPSVCLIRPVNAGEADPFYDRFHYIGPCRPKVSYGAFLRDRLICCMSFSHPTRQSRHPWELVRMASDPEYRVHGIWSKLLKTFVREHRPVSIVSFSDNRLFSGGVYEKIGFSYDGEVPPDYYWVKGQRRFHKSGLRKKGEEKQSGLTEAQLREAQGYRKIWDLGKKRWVFIQTVDG